MGIRTHFLKVDMCTTDTPSAQPPEPGRHSDEDIARQNAFLQSFRHIDPFSTDFVPIPDGEGICRLHAIRAGVVEGSLALFELGGKDDEFVDSICFSFLIEKLWSNGGAPTRAIFDLGVRAGGFDKPLYKNFEKKAKPDTGSGVAKILQSMNVPVESIQAIILGHNHVDHVGDLRTFPPSVDLVVGPDTVGLDELANAMDVPRQTLEERTVRYMSREKDKWQDIGTFKGHDYFGDGSLFILDAPGHVPGHICVLVRTSSSPPVYHLLASDTTHKISLLRSPKDPSIPRKEIGLFPKGLLYGETHCSGGTIPLQSMHTDLAEAYKTIAKAERMDLEDNVNVILAHDSTMDIALGGRGRSETSEYVTLDGTKEELFKLKSRDWENMHY